MVAAPYAAGARAAAGILGQAARYTFVNTAGSVIFSYATGAVGGYAGNLAGTYFYGENAGRYWGLAGGIIGGVVGYQTAPRVFNALDNITVSTKIAGAAVEGVGNKSVLNAGSKADAIESVDNLPSNIQSKVKNFFKGGSNSYTDFSVEQMGNGNYMAKMTKPGNIPGSKAIYYKEIDPSGNTLRAFKETFDPSGNLVHIKDK